MSTRIAIGVPCNRVIKPKTMQCLLDMVNYEADIEFLPIIATEGYTISENRNYLAAKSVSNNCDELLFIDDDMTFPPDLAERLLSHGKDIVGTIAHSRMESENTHVTMFDGSILKTKDVPDELFKAKAVGTGVLMINTAVFHEIDRPFFNTETHETGFTLLGEDYWFCRQAERKGIDIWIDPTIQIGHLGDYIYE